MILKFILIILLICTTAFGAELFPVNQKLLCVAKDAPDGFVIVKISKHLFEITSGGAETDYYRIVKLTKKSIELVRTVQGDFDGVSSSRVDEDEWVYLKLDEKKKFHLTSKRKAKKYPVSVPCRFLVKDN